MQPLNQLAVVVGRSAFEASREPFHSAALYLPGVLRQRARWWSVPRKHARKGDR